MIDPMTDLDPTAQALGRAEAEYSKARARLAALKSARVAARAVHRAAIIAAVTSNPEASHVEVAARFGVTEGTIRGIRRSIGLQPAPDATNQSPIAE